VASALAYLKSALFGLLLPQVILLVMTFLLNSAGLTGKLPDEPEKSYRSCIFEQPGRGN